MTTHVLIELNQIDSRATREAETAAQRAAYAQPREDSFYRDTDELGENGDDESESTQASTTPPAAEVLRPVLVDPMDIRTISHRRHDKPGSRLTFSSGSGFAVAESYEELKAKLAEAGVRIVNRTEPQLLAFTQTAGQS